MEAVSMKKIALVEDNPDNRLLVEVILQERFEVVSFENGSAALAGIPVEAPQVVLLDISLPEMDGTEVLRRLRAEPATAGLPVIALTAHAMAGDREKYLELGFDGYVSKPILDEADLFTAIDQAIEGKSQR